MIDIFRASFPRSSSLSFLILLFRRYSRGILPEITKCLCPNRRLTSPSVSYSDMSAKTQRGQIMDYLFQGS
ncbi:hypothetical protein V8C37DRAFT_372570 [Trichoderma ceciliae]